MIYDDENDLYNDGDDGDEYEGFSVTDATGAEMDVSRPEKKKRKKESWDDGETVEASPIPENEQTVMIDEPNVAELSPGAPLTLVVSGETVSVFSGETKAGSLKPAFVKKLSETRKGLHAECTLFSVSAPVMVKLKFYSRARKNTLKI